MVAMLMVFGIASFAAAEVEMGGDARVRGISKDNPDMNSDSDDAMRYYDQRVRLKLKGTNDDGASVNVRVTVAEGVWNGGKNTKSGGDTVSGAGVVNASGNDPIKIGGSDYAYIAMPVAEGWTVSAGLMPADWGHKFKSWANSAERLKVTGKLGDVTVGAFVQKDVETDATGSNNLDDKDTTGLLAIGKAGEFKIGALYMMTKDNRPTAADCATDPKCDPSSTGADADGSNLDIFFAGPAGPVALAGEFRQQSGDLNETSQGDSPNGMFIAGTMDVGVKVSAALAMTKNGFVANKYFTPHATIGTSQPTAVANLGQGLPGQCPTLTTCTADTTALVVGVSHVISDEMTVGASIMQATLSAYDEDPTAEDGTLTAIDVKFTYSLGEKTKYTLVVAQATPDVDNGDLDKVTNMMHQLSTSF
jgi:hypothetical protein